MTFREMQKSLPGYIVRTEKAPDIGMGHFDPFAALEKIHLYLEVREREVIMHGEFLKP